FHVTGVQTCALPISTQMEEWRYTDVALLKLDEVELEEAGGDAGSADTGLLGLTGDAAGRALQVGSRLVEAEVAEDLRERGVIVMDLAAAAEAHPDLVEPYLGTERKSTRLN